MQEEGEETQEEAAEPAAGKRSAKGTAESGGDKEPSTSGAAAVSEGEAGPALKRPKFSKLGKDPGVQTNFLPDKDRELQEEELKKRLKEVSNTCVSSVFARPQYTQRLVAA